MKTLVLIAMMAASTNAYSEGWFWTFFNSMANGLHYTGQDGVAKIPPTACEWLSTGTVRHEIWMRLKRHESAWFILTNEDNDIVVAVKARKSDMEPHGDDWFPGERSVFWPAIPVPVGKHHAVILVGGGDPSLTTDRWEMSTCLWGLEPKG